MLLRDKIILTIGCAGVIGIGLAAIFLRIRNPEIALAALTIFAGLLGFPGVVRLDEIARRRRNGE
jgi:energy-converting hydrogenase Eha subunit A